MKNEYKIGLGISVLIAIIIAIIILTRKPSVPSGPSGPSVPSGPSGPSVPSGPSGPAPSTVKITSEGIQFPKPSTTEGYMSEQVSCKKLQVLEPSAFENGNMNGFSDYASYEAHRNDFDSKKWGENGWCKLSGFTDENQNALGYFYHEGDYNYGAFDMDTGKCKFTGDDKPYTCLYKEIKDGEFITGFENNDGKRLEVVFYNDYKAGKLDKWFESIGIGNRIKFILNNEGKLEVSINDPEKGSGSFVIKPGNNYQVQFMLLGTALAMVDNNIPMPETGLNIRFTSLNENDVKKNYNDELSKIISDL